MVAFTYDDAGRPVTESSSVAGGAPVTLTSTYDLAGNRTGLADSFGGSAAFGFDGAGRLATLLSASGTTVFGHDASGRPDSILFPNDASAMYTYDTSGRMESITHRDGASSVLAAFAMGYNAVGSITSIVDASPAPRLRDFGYDALQRLRSETVTIDPAPAVPHAYDYDAVGNRTTSPLSASYSHNAANRLLSDDDFTYTHDGNGNLTFRTSKADTSQATRYRWDSRNELAQIDFPGGGHAYYRYDALGRRIEKNASGVVTRYVYDGEDIALETDSAGTLLRRYRHGDGIDQPLVLEDVASGDSFFYHADHLGSVRLITDETGAVVSEYDYDAYGRRTAISEAIAQPYAYTGREWDEESGLYYYRARYYDPSQGRFLSEDPIGFGGGDANFYVYVAESPVGRKDPDGRDWIYSQSSGLLVQYAMSLLIDMSYVTTPDMALMSRIGEPAPTNVAEGYSGKGEGQNNPLLQGKSTQGPIPQGDYDIGEMRDNRTQRGRTLYDSMRLTEHNGNMMFGRSGFLIHDDFGSRRESEGCIATPLPARNDIRDSLDRLIRVIL